MLRAIRATAALLVSALAGAAAAQSLSDNQIVELAGQGRYEELAQRLARAERLNPGEQHALCYALSRIKRYRRLFDCLDRLQAALRGADRASILFGLDDATPTVHLMRAEALLEVGQVPRAAEEAARALAWFDKQGTAGERDLQIDALAAAALAAARQREPGKAADYLKRIEAIKVGIAAGPNVATARTFALARVHLALGNYERACAALDADKGFDFRQSVERLLHFNPPHWVWQELPRNFMAAKCRFGMGRIAEAKERYDALLALPAIRQNSGIHWLVLFDRGRIAFDEGDVESALRLWREAIEIIELLRSSIDTEAAKIGFVGDKQTVYGALVSTLLARGRAAEALEYVERAKSRALVDLLADRYATAEHRLDRGNPQLAGLLERHRQAEEALTAQAPRDNATFERQRNALLAAAQGLRQAAPELASLVVVSPASANELAALLDANEVGVQYFQYGEALFALTFGPGGSRGFTLEGKDLLKDVRDFRNALTALRPQANELARRLYARLIAPLEGAIGGRPLLLVPHGALHYLPFAALHDGKQYLVQKHALRVMTSASALKYLRPAAASGPSGALIFGNPTLDLPSAEDEARLLAKLLPASRVLIGAQATKRALIEDGARFRTIHIAGHGIFEAQRPLESRLVFAGEELKVNEIYNLALAADLVTLSACESGLGRITDGDDVIGLTRGFLYAGAASVVASLWKVADEATVILMERFYANLKKMNKREALRAAQIETSRKHPEPYFWAAFYLTGAAR
jgi:CHAT domain-containing protein